MQNILKTGDFSEFPKKLLSEVVRTNKQTGSSTFIISSIGKESQKLKTAFLGDSGKKIKNK